MRLKRKLLKGRIIYILYCLLMLVLAFVFNRFFQMLMFILFFEVLQGCFAWRFHADTIESDPIKAVKYCKLITVGIEIIYLIFCKNLNITIYSNLFIIFLIAFINCILQFVVERLVVKSLKFYDKDTLIKLCKEANLTYEATNRIIMKYIEHKTFKEIAIIENVEEKTIKMSINRSKKKLNIK